MHIKIAGVFWMDRDLHRQMCLGVLGGWQRAGTPFRNDSLRGLANIKGARSYQY
jgi:hypothetical protein